MSVTIRSNTAMATCECFNTLFCEFVDDLSSTFDEHQSLQVVHASLLQMIGENKSTPLPACIFQSTVGNFSAPDIERKTPALVAWLHNTVKSVGLQVDVQRDYDSCDDAIKEAIWDYVNRLHSIAALLAEDGSIDTVDTKSVETVMASVSSMCPAKAEAMTSSVMCLVPPGLKDFVDEKVMQCQQQIESGEMSPDQVMQQIQASMIGHAQEKLTLP